MSIGKHYVYLHIRPDTGAVFYVGKGTSRKQGCFARAHAHDHRNTHWCNIVSKAGLEIEVAATYDTNADALFAEQRLIKWFSRSRLCNMTDGGEGTLGMESSTDLRAKRSVAASRPRSEKWVQSVRRARKNGGNGGVVKKGDKLPDWWKERISSAVTGERNHMYGRTGDSHPSSRSVVNIETGERFASVTEAAAKNGFNMKTLHNIMTGHRPNRTPFRFEVQNAS